MVGISEIKAIINDAIEAIRSESGSFWKNIPRFMIAKDHNGRKIVAKEAMGCLQIGMLKKLYWKYFYGL